MYYIKGILYFCLSYLFKFVFTLETANNSKTITSKIFNIYGANSIPFYVGTNQTFCTFQLDLQNDITYISSSSFQNSPYLMTQSIIINNKTYSARKIRTTAVFHSNHNLIKNFILYFISPNTIDQATSYETLTLSFNSINNDKDSNLLRSLYEINQIDSKQFTVGYNQGELVFQFGENTLVTKDSKNSNKIECNVKKNKWGCQLNAIEIRGTNENVIKGIYTKLNYVLFNLKHNKIYVPYIIYREIENTVMKDYVANQTCAKSKVDSSLSYYCFCNSIEYFPEFMFYLEKGAVQLKSKLLFTNLDGICVFLMKVNERSPNEFEFGASFVNQFITEFDYETKSVTLYESDSETKGKIFNDIRFIFVEHNNVIKNVLTLLSCVLLISCIIFVKKVINI